MVNHNGNSLVFALTIIYVEILFPLCRLMANEKARFPFVHKLNYLSSKTTKPINT